MDPVVFSGWIVRWVCFRASDIKALRRIFRRHVRGEWLECTNFNQWFHRLSPAAWKRGGIQYKLKNWQAKGT
jgi:hypothetical protein